MSAVVEGAGLGVEWERLERTAEQAAHALAGWRTRAREAEDEVERLRRTLEELAAGRDGSGADLAQEMKRLKAENVALRSRMLQTRKRVAALMQRLAALEVADG